MKISDFLIIYLACGAPFGVFFYLQHRHEKNSLLLYLKSLGLVFVWIPYAVWLLHGFITKHFRQQNERKSGKSNLGNLQKQFTQMIFESDSKISPYEFREVFDRYAGLTSVKNSANQIPTKANEEFYRIALRENVKLAAGCLERRNRSKVEFHQILARKDFLRVVSELKTSALDPEKLWQLSVETTEILNDSEALDSINEIFAQNLQSPNENSVQVSGKKLWMPKEHKQSSTTGLPIYRQVLTTPGKD